LNATVYEINVPHIHPRTPRTKPNMNPLPRKSGYKWNNSYGYGEQHVD